MELESPALQADSLQLSPQGSPEYFSAGEEIRILKTYLHFCVHGSAIHNSQDKVTTQVCSRWMNEYRKYMYTHGHGLCDPMNGSPPGSPENLPDPGIKPGCPALAGKFFTSESPRKPIHTHTHTHTHEYYLAIKKKFSHLQQWASLALPAMWES